MGFMVTAASARDDGGAREAFSTASAMRALLRSTNLSHDTTCADVTLGVRDACEQRTRRVRSAMDV